MAALLLLLAAMAVATPTSYAPVVQELVELVAHDVQVRDLFIATLNGTGATLTDMYDFWNSWLVFYCEPATAQRFDDAWFSSIGNPGAASKLLLHVPAAMAWGRRWLAARGRAMDATASAVVLPVWEADPAVQIKLFKRPSDGYGSFNEFFRRTFIAGARPVCAGPPNTLASPIEGTLSQTPSQDLVRIKGYQLNVTALMGGSRFADHFTSASASLVLGSLNVTNYHHFHAPLDGTVVEVHRAAGVAFSVLSAQMFWESSIRTAIVLDTAVGYVALVPVGIMDIAGVRVRVAPGSRVQRGADLGFFQFGGSVVVMLTERPVQWTVSLNGTQVLVGACVGTM